MANRGMAALRGAQHPSSRVSIRDPEAGGGLLTGGGGGEDQQGGIGGGSGEHLFHNLAESAHSFALWALATVLLLLVLTN